MNNKTLILDPDMDETGVLAAIGRFIWESISPEQQAMFERHAQEEGLERGEMALLHGLIEDKQEYETVEDWLSQLPGGYNISFKKKK